MQKFFQSLLTSGIVVIAYGCGGDQTPGGSTTSQPPSHLYSIRHAYDVGNNNNASDLRVELALPVGADISQLTEVRLVISKASAPFTETQIGDLSDANSLLIPLSQETQQVLHPTTAKDTDGEAIVNDVPYALYVVAVGNAGYQELSAAETLTLVDQPIFVGSYRGTWEDLGPPGPGKYPMSMRIDSAYSVKMFYTGTYTAYGRGAQDATATFTVDQGKCTLAVNQFIAKYIGGGQFTDGADGGCPASKTLSCSVVDEVELVFDVFNWADCDGTRDVRLSYIKQ